MKKILVSGLINIETSVNVDHFPVEYNPIEYPFFGVNNCISGVGYNVAKAVKILGEDADLLSVIGNDIYSEVIKSAFKKEHINSILLPRIEQTPTSIVIVDREGKRKIYCDLKDIQDKEPLDESVINVDDYSLAVLTNINFNRKLLKVFHDKGITIATDVHVLSYIENEYNRDFMENADILFFSNEGVVGHEEEFIKALYNRYHNKIIVCGCGDRGAVMYVGYEDKLYYQKAVAPKGVKSTLGAGDALFSAFIYFYKKGENLQKCLQNAVIFAGLKISASGGSNGFVSEKELLQYLPK